MEVLRNPDEILLADVEESKIMMEAGQYRYEPLMPLFDEKEEEEFEGVEEGIIKQALQSSRKQ